MFDFDGILINSPEPTEENKNKYARHYNIPKYPHRGWWSKLESLDGEVFNIKVIESVMPEYQRARRDPDGLVIAKKPGIKYVEIWD